MGRSKLLILGEHRVLGRLQHAVEAAQHNHREHHEPILRRTVWPAQPVGNLPDLIRDFLVTFGKQITSIVADGRRSPRAVRCTNLCAYRVYRIWEVGSRW